MKTKGVLIMVKIIEFIDSIIDAYITSEEANISERSTETEKDFKDLEKDCIAYKQEFVNLLNEYEIRPKGDTTKCLGCNFKGEEGNCNFECE